MLDRFLSRCLLWDTCRWRINGLRGKGHRTGRRRIERPNDPVHRQMRQDNHDQGGNRNSENVRKFHLFCEGKTKHSMQTNPIRAEELAVLDAQIDAVYSAIKGGIRWDNLVPTLLTGARILETMPGLKGSQKLDILQKTLKHALKESDCPTLEKEQILHTIDTVVPIVMQAAILASKVPIVNQALAKAQSVCCAWW